MYLELVLGTERLVVDTATVSTKKVIELSDKFLEVKKKYLLISKYPLLDLGEGKQETMEDWSLRVAKILTEEEVRKEGEDIMEYLSRRHKPDLEKIEVYKDAFKAIAETVDQGHKVTDETMMEAPYTAIRDVVKRVLSDFDLNEKYFD